MERRVDQEAIHGNNQEQQPGLMQRLGQQTQRRLFKHSRERSNQRRQNSLQRSKKKKIKKKRSGSTLSKVPEADQNSEGQMVGQMVPQELNQVQECKRSPEDDLLMVPQELNQVQDLMDDLAQRCRRSPEDDLLRACHRQTLIWKRRIQVLEKEREEFEERREKREKPKLQQYQANEEFYQQNEEIQERDGKIVCPCGSLLLPKNFQKHLDTKTHISKMQNITRKRFFTQSYIHCQCGQVVHKSFLGRHMSSQRHKLMNVKKEQLLNTTITKCECGQLYSSQEQNMHIASSRHNTNMTMVQKGLVKKTIKHQQKTQYEQQSLCCICYQSGSDVQTQCKHIFHKTCLRTWHQFESKNLQRMTCPTCRTQIQN